MTGNPKDSASNDVDAVVLSLDVELADSPETAEAPPAEAPVHSPSRPTKLDRPSGRNTALDLKRQDAPAPEPSADAAVVAPLPGPAPTAEPLSREALIDAVFTAPGAFEWLDRLALALAVNGSTEGWEHLPVEPRQETRQAAQVG
jgi:hypothetical protein